MTHDGQVRTVINRVSLNETRDMHSSVAVSGEDWSLGERQLVSPALRSLSLRIIEQPAGLPCTRAAQATQAPLLG